MSIEEEFKFYIDNNAIETLNKIMLRLDGAEGYCKITNKDINLINTLSEKFQQSFEDFINEDKANEYLVEINKLSIRLNKKMSRFTSFRNPKFLENMGVQ